MKGGNMKPTSAKMKTLEFIKNSNGTSRVELSKELNISRAGIGKIVNAFLEKGIHWHQDLFKYLLET